MDSYILCRNMKSMANNNDDAVAKPDLSTETSSKR